MTTRQHIWQLLLTCLVLLALVACSASSPLVAPTPTTGTLERARTVLVLWHAWPAPEDRTLAMIVERYNRSQSAVQIVLQAHSVATLTNDLSLAVSEGGGPHVAILQNHTLGGLVEDGTILPIDDLFSSADLSQLLPSALGGAYIATPNGETLYGLPITFDTLALYYNTANFAATPPSDTATLLAVARGLTDTQSDPPTWGLALNLSLDRTIGYLYAFGGQIFNAEHALVLGLDGRVGTEAWLTWLESLHSDARILASTDSILVENALMNREALMTFDWSYALSTYRDLWSEHMGVALLPRLSDSDQWPQPYVQSDIIVMNVRIGIAEREAARDFMRYLLNSDSQISLLQAGRQPTLLSLDLTTTTAVSSQIRAAALVFRRQALQGLPMPNSRQTNDMVWNVLTDMHANTLRRLLTPAQAVSDADRTLREYLATPPLP